MKLFLHQEKALESARNFDHVAFYLDMGLGKTFVATEQMKYFNNDVNIVICQNSKVNDWTEHLEKFYDYEVFAIKTKTDVVNFLNYSGKKVAVINYEKVYRENYSLHKEKNITLIVDESSVLGSSKTKIVKFTRKFKYKNLILLSGTPVSGKYEKLWVQLSMLGLDMTENVFKNNFLNLVTMQMGIMRFATLDKNRPYKNVERLKRIMRELGCIFMKTDEVFDLPMQNFIDVKVGKEKVYKTFEKDKIVKLGDKTFMGDTAFAERLGLRQLASIHSKNKEKALIDILNSTDDRLIIFYNFNDELKLLKSIIKRPISEVNGSKVDKVNYEKYDNSVTLMQYQAGAKGHNMQLANKLIFFSPTEKCEDYMQALKRIHRIGQERPCFYYKLIVDGSIEEDIYRNLDRGEDYTDELFRKRNSRI